MGHGIGDRLYDNAASFGRFTSTISLVLALVLAASLCCTACVMLAGSAGAGSSVATARVTSGGCLPVLDRSSSGVEYRCVLDLEFKDAKGKKVKTTYVGNLATRVAAGSTMEVEYSPDNPKSVQPKGTKGALAVMASSICSSALCVVLFGVIGYMITTRFKFAAAGAGAGAVVGMFR